MSEDMEQKLETLRTDFGTIVGRPFKHFYCPILFRDEPVPLCKAHVLNQAFYSASRAWTVQREDVDNFFGSAFESEFVLLQERGKYSPEEILADSYLSKKLRPKILVDGQELPHYRATGAIPEQHTELLLEVEGRPTAQLALKLSQSEALTTLGQDWSIEIGRDIRLPALVSLLKAAHLTLFELLGYSYALSAGGYFLGSDVLGKFFLDNREKRKSEILKSAKEHFTEFQNLVRPFAVAPSGLAGTITDGMLFLCADGAKPWGFVVLVRTGAEMHSVLVPYVEDDTSAAKFYSFMRQPPPQFQVKLAKFSGDHWEISTNSQIANWPTVNFEDTVLP